MRGEQTTLWSFGGGVDPGALELDEDKEVRVRKEFLNRGRDQPMTDLGIRLERDLVERLEPQLLETGENQHRLRLSPQQADWIDAMYIRAEPTDESGKFVKKVREPDDYPAVWIPRAWLQREVVNGRTNPFHDADPDDHVVVRYLPEGAIEIYTEEVYYAHPHSYRIRAATPVVVMSHDEFNDIPCFNLAASTPSDGHMFEIVPFDWNVFQEYIDEDRYTSSGTRLPVDEFNRVLAERDVKPCSAPLLQIHQDTGSLFLREILSSPGEETRCLELRDIGWFRVILPAKRMVQICSFMESSIESQMLVHQSLARGMTLWPAEGGGFANIGPSGIFRNEEYIAQINDHWYGRFFEIPEHGPPIIYLPVNRGES